MGARGARPVPDLRETAELDYTTSDEDVNLSEASVPSPTVVTPPRVVNPVNMVDYDVDDQPDDTDAQKEARNIKIAFDRQDVKAWLTRFEIRLEFAGVKTQWLKRLCLENVLPEDIASSCKDYFCKPKTECTGDLKNIYKEPW